MTTTARPVPDPDTDALDTAQRGWNPMWYHPLLAAAWLFFLAWLPGWSGLSPWWWAGVGLVAAPLAVMVVTVKVPPAVYGRRVYERSRLLAGAAALSAAGWLVYAGHEIEQRVGRAVGTLVFWLLLVGSSYALLRMSAPRRAAEIRADREQVRAEQEEVRLRTDVAQRWDGWFAQAGVAVEIEDVRPTPAGYTLLLASMPDAKGVYSTFRTLTGAITTLATLASRHYRRTEGKTVRRYQIRPEETVSEDQWLLHVNIEQPLKHDLPHPGDRGAGDWTQPATLGLYEDGEPLTLELFARHIAMVGATGSGKSVVLHNMLDAATRCPNVIVFVATTSKLMPIVWPWLEPWLDGTTQRPVIEYVAGESLAEVLHLLKTAYRYCKERNSRLGPGGSKHIPTVEDPALFIVIDEATDVANAKEEVVTTFDGKEWKAPKLLSYLAATLRSAGGSVMFLTQTGLYDALGTADGPTTMRNVGIRIAGRTESPHDGNVTLRNIKGVDTTELRDNMIYVQANYEIPRAIAAKVRLLDDTRQIRALAIANTRYRPSGFPAWLTAKLGPTWADRWLPQRQETLVAACERAGVRYPVTADGRPAPGRTLHPDLLPAQPGHQEPADKPADEGVTEPAGQAPSPGGALPINTTGGTLVPMSTTTHNNQTGPTPGRGISGDVSRAVTPADVIRASNEALAAMQDMREYPLGKSLTFARRAFNMHGAPDTATAEQLALASGLVSRDATDAEIEHAAGKIVRAVAKMVPVLPVQGGTAAEHVLTRDQVVAAWDTALGLYREFQQANTPAGDNAGDDGFVGSVVDAVADHTDDQWITVADLGRAAGHIPPDGDGDEVREAARQFSEQLRKRFGLDADAFKRTARGTAVQVGALRAAARATT